MICFLNCLSSPIGAVHSGQVTSDFHKILTQDGKRKRSFYGDDFRKKSAL